MMKRVSSLPMPATKFELSSSGFGDKNLQEVTDGTYSFGSEFQAANISQSQARIMSDGKLQETSNFYSTLVYANEYWAVVMVVSAAAFLFGFLIMFSKYRKKRRLKENYEEFPEVHMTRQKVSKPVDPAVYNYVCPQRSIDFVVPSIASTSLHSPSDAKEEVPSPEGSGTLWSKLTLLEGGPTLLGGLNPELYKVVPEESPEDVNFPDGHRGRLWFSVNYDTAAERLVVSLIKAKNLPSRVYGSVNCCDPFVRIYLMPDERRHLQSKLKKKTCNPRFDETFVFQVPGRSEEERLLKFTVFDNDRGKHHNAIGHVFVPLNEVSKTSLDTATQWRDLEKDGDVQIPSDLGEMMLSLCYNQSLERLIVTVCEARGLRLPEGFKVLDSYAKLTLMKENKPVKSKKTMVVKNSRNPKYNESFHFRLSQNAINSTSIIVQVTQVGGKEKDKSLGRVVLGSYMFSRGKGLEHWDEAMSAGHKQIRFWHKLV